MLREWSRITNETCANAARHAECCKQTEKPAPRKRLPAAAALHAEEEEGGQKTAVEERLEERAE